MAGNITGSSFNNLTAFKPQIYPLQFIQKFYAGSITNYMLDPAPRSTSVRSLMWLSVRPPMMVM
jgi:hypothetical protein